MTSWENPVPVAAFISSADLQARTQSDPPPEVSFIDDARSREYDTVCVPLTNVKWRDRWRDMCIITSEHHNETVETTERHAETWRANPAFELGEVTMTRLGICPLLHERLVASTDTETRGSEEADGVIVMISDWLELDASDSWVRHDSEIVRVLFVCASIYWSFHTHPRIPCR
jgi:type II protein arginine methyltransferase